MLALLCRLLVAGGLLAYFVYALRFDIVVQNVRNVGLLACAAAFALLVAQFLVLGYRWHRILRASAVRLRLGWAVKVVFIGLFFNQCLPTSLGGDGVRVLRLRSAKVPLETAINLVLVDRLSGLACLAPFLVCGVPFLFEWADEPILGILDLALSIILFAVLALYFFADQLAALAGPLANLRPIAAIAGASSYARAVVLHSPGAAGTAGLAVATHLLTILVVIVLAGGLGATLSFATALVLVPPVIAAAMLPISFGGWGTREVAMMASLGVAGVPPATGLAISIVLGFGLFLATLPGGLFWLMGKRLRADHDKAF
jgi:uncharacterized membrane protein YbhN (UPF0104 family)